MFNSYSPWGELSLQPHLSLRWALFDDPDQLGAYDHETLTITLASDLCRRQARSVLAHELRHAEYGDTSTDCRLVNVRQEQRADREAAWLMIDIRDLARAMVVHSGHVSAAAVELSVSDELLRVRLDSLHPLERGYLSRHMSDVLVA